MSQEKSPPMRRLLIAAVLTLLLLGSTLPFGSTLAVLKAQGTPTPEELLADLEETTGGQMSTSSAGSTGDLTMVRATGDAVLMPADLADDPVTRAFHFLSNYGGLMRIDRPQEQLALHEIVEDQTGATHVRLSQVHEGVPVFGAQVVVHMNHAGITGLNGTFVSGISVDTTPTLDAESARQAAVSAIIKEDATASAEEPFLYVYNEGVLQRGPGQNALAYAVPVHAEQLDEQVWIDAHDGSFLNRISLRQEDLYRIIYSPEYDPQNPDENVRREEGDPPTLVPPFDNLYRFAGQVYHFFLNAFGRDSYDGAGHVMRSVYLVNTICPNAYWNGETTNYCPGFDIDDVVAHEWGHAYTEYTHGLVYQWQSGALNESYSDIWGEAVDLHNGEDGIGGSNNEEPYPDGQRWIVGEDLSDVVVTLLLRDMWDPERLGYPAKVSSSNYYCSADDNGGVHYNSGVPNHAFAMLVDGKSFNGQTVEGIGFNKAVQIYWRAANVYQVPSTGFPEHADALEASCQDLVGQEVPDFQTGLPSGETITEADCSQVEKAMLAVEMRQEPLQCDFEPLLDPNTPAMCDTPQYVLQEDWETGMDGWSLTSERAEAPSGDAWPNYNWELVDALPSGREGTGLFAIDEVTGTCAPGGDISGHFTVDSPLFNIPDPLEDLELRFDHWVATEAQWDGGNLKVSINGGDYSVVPDEAFTFNPYNDTLNDSLVDGNTNPLAGERAWTGSNPNELSGSWGTTIVDLTALDVSPGDTVQLRWDFGVDGCNGNVGWYLDNVDVFTCSGTIDPTPTPTPQPEENGGEATGSGWLQGNGGQKVNFGFKAEDTGNGLSGDLRLNDKGAEVKIDVTQITDIGAVSGACGDSGIVAGDNALEFSGTGTLNGDPAEIRVCLEDNGNPGQGNDLFYLECTGGCSYATSGRAANATLGGGNVQVRRSATSSTEESGQSEPRVLILDPLLRSEGIAGNLQTFEVAVYDQYQNVMSGAAITLTRVAADGTTESFSAISDASGIAVFTTTTLAQAVEYRATAGAAESNTISVEPILQ